MWKEYCAEFIRQNRVSCISVVAASFISALFLSLLCSLYYNFWAYEMEGTGEKASALQGRGTMLLGFWLVILLVMAVSLILIIHNAFAVSMNARIHQLGIFFSVGATPGQIRVSLLQEAGILCGIPVLVGDLFGLVLSFGVIQAVNRLAEGIDGRREAVWSYHPLVFAVAMAASVGTVLVSAWLPAWKLSRLTPLQALRGAGDPWLKKKRDSRVLAAVFGIEGELAGNALKAQRKALRTSSLSLTLSFLGFTLMLCFFTLSGISTDHTYFERYQDAWDVMVTVKDTELEEFAYGEELRNLPDVRSSAVYQKAEAVCQIPETAVSGEVRELGGLKALAGEAVETEQGGYQVQAPLVILDDSSFEEYCSEIGIVPDTGGCIVLNRIWDSENSSFRYREYVPFIEEEMGMLTLLNSENSGSTAEIPVLAYTREVPVLREEYEDYALVQFLPLSIWEQVKESLGDSQPDLYIRILAEEPTLEKLNALEMAVEEQAGQEYTLEMENRIQEKLDNDRMIQGYQLLIGAFCVLLAMIGIANLFSNTLGFLQQRKREFARYLSIGMTPESMGKMLGIEAAVIAGRPLLITVPLAAGSVSFMITVSGLRPVEFLTRAPVVPASLFFLMMAASVALVYWIGARRLLGCDLTDILQNDTLL